MRFKILTAGDASPKLAKFHDLLAAVLYLAPYTIAGMGNVCPWSRGCRVHCLYKQGRGQFSAVQRARIRRTRLLFKRPDAFRAMLHSDLCKLERVARERGMPAVCRLNGTSDLDWSQVYRRYPGVRFWEYTKSVERVERYLAGSMPGNVHVCYSRNESHGDAAALRLRERGAVVVVVFRVPRRAALPSAWHGLPVSDGDVNDARWRDAPGSVVGLRAKGSAMRDRTGFVVG